MLGRSQPSGREDLGVEAAPPSVASRRWPPCGSLKLLGPKVVPVSGNPGVPFVYQLKLEAGTVGKHPPALKHSTYPFAVSEGILPGSLFYGHSSRFHSSPLSKTFIFGAEEGRIHVVLVFGFVVRVRSFPSSPLFFF